MKISAKQQQVLDALAKNALIEVRRHHGDPRAKLVSEDGRVEALDIRTFERLKMRKQIVFSHTFEPETDVWEIAQ